MSQLNLALGPSVASSARATSSWRPLLTDEAAVIARAQRGDTAAYEALMRAYQQIAFRVAFLVTHDEQEAADAAQDAFIRAYRALGSFNVEQPFRPWLLRIVTNLAINRLRAAQRRMRAMDSYARELIAGDDRPSPDGHLARVDQSDQLFQAVRKLAPDEQSLITLKYWMELPESELAEIFNVPVGTIKSRLHRTLGHLRDIIRVEFPDLSLLDWTNG